MNNMWLEPYWRVTFPSVTKITGGHGITAIAKIAKQMTVA
ncbi:hypothetical protein SAMN05192541_1335 [Bradyrhizobium arachidis]|nr:hypothetical protein SAMN05192541_1335 [Bradyrhizobium arachidis]